MFIHHVAYILSLLLFQTRSKRRLPPSNTTSRIIISTKVPNIEPIGFLSKPLFSSLSVLYLLHQQFFFFRKGGFSLSIFVCLFYYFASRYRTEIGSLIRPFGKIRRCTFIHYSFIFLLETDFVSFEEFAFPHKPITLSRLQHLRSQPLNSSPKTLLTSPLLSPPPHSLSPSQTSHNSPNPSLTYPIHS